MPDNLKILYLDSNVSYLNPTRNIVSLMFKCNYDVVFYGPGYRTVDELTCGLDAFIEKNGPFDIAVATEHIIFSPLWGKKSSIKRVYTRNHVIKFDINHLKFVSNIYESFCRLASIKVATLLESDYYNFTIDQIKILEDIDFIIGWNDQFVHPIKELQYLKNESFAKHANDNYFNFVEKNKHRIISLPAFVSETEFCWSPINNRKFMWSVLGARYWSRNEAKRILNSLRINYKASDWSIFYSLLDKLNLHPYANPLLQKFYNYSFCRVLESSKYSYTCGSGLGYPIRKFFEIPAHGCVLVCLPCNGFEALGFKDKVNAIACMPEEIIDVHNFLKSNPEKAQSIASAGRELIWQKHTTHARSLQIHTALSAIREGNFCGSYWHEGDFYILKKTVDGQIMPVMAPSSVQSSTCTVRDDR